MCRNLLSRPVAVAAIVPLLILGMTNPAGATATASSSGTLDFQVIDVQDSGGNSLPMAPPGFSLTLGGATLNQLSNPGNNGSGMLTFGGSATSSGSGRTSVIDLDSDVQCTSNPQGSYAGIEDAFESSITVSNTSGQDITLILQFDASFALATSTTVAGETAQADIDINWALPSGTSGVLTNCPAGSLAGSTLLLGQSSVSGGSSDSQAISSCEIAVTVPDGIANSGGLAASLSSCEATSPLAALAPVAVPALPALAVFALAALLVLSGGWVLRRRLH